MSVLQNMSPTFVLILYLSICIILIAGIGLCLYFLLKIKHQKISSKVLLIIALILLCLLIIPIFFRLVLPSQLINVTPQKTCKNLINKAKFIWITPIENGKKISENKTWCSNLLLKPQKIQGIFLKSNDKDVLEKNIEEFFKCFSYYPKYFKGSINKEDLIEKLPNAIIVGPWFDLFHQTYSCNN